MRVLDPDASGFDMADPPGMSTEKEYVAGDAFHGEVFVERSHHFSVGFGDHGVGRVFRDRSAGGDGSQTGATAASHAMVHLVAMQHRTATAARCGDAFGEHLDYTVE